MAPPLPVSFRFFATLVSIALATSEMQAGISVSALFSDHAVLQATTEVPIWGKAEPGEKVDVTLGNARASSVAGADGKWRVNLDLSSATGGPFDLIIQGRNRLVASDVLVGQVWLCSGQSNMEWPLRGSGGAAEEIPRSSNPQLRHFKVEKSASAIPLDDVKGAWVVATPETTPEFSAISYYFGQNIQHELGAPVGLINASWGGTPVEAWARLGAYDSDPLLKAGAEKARADAAYYQGFLKNYRAWVELQGRQDRKHPAAGAFLPGAQEAGGWMPVAMPCSLASAGLPGAGAVWISRKITLPADAVGSGLQVWFGDVRDSVSIYWNGLLLGEGDIETISHRYALHGKRVTSTEGVLSARIFNPSGSPGIVPGKERFRLDYKGGSIQLGGEWQAKVEYAFPPLPSGAEPCPVKAPLPRPDQEVAAYLFNGMIHPLIPAAVAGVIYNHGTSNSERAWQYRFAFPLMIADWRKQWGRGDFPFYFCQLYNFQPPPENPGESLWAEVREGQTSALSLPNTAMAVLIDVGESGNIHPAEKRSPGERLARLALAKSYGRAMVASGPMWDSMNVEADKVRVNFSGAAGGLVAKPVEHTVTRPESPVQGFAICGADRKWVWAQAAIKGNSVEVWSPDVPNPVAVRYAWADNPVCNLLNGANLPASPFRTDDFPQMSLKNKY